MSDDAELYRRWMAGDPDAGASLVARHHEPMVRALAGQVGSHALALDLAQETWVEAQRGGYAGRGSFAAWLGAVSRTQMNRHFRKRAGELDARAPTSPSQHVLRVEVLQALAELSQTPQREAVHLRYVEGFTIAEVAEQIGAKPKTVDSRLRLGVAKLRARLRAESPRLALVTPN